MNEEKSASWGAGMEREKIGNVQKSSSNVSTKKLEDSQSRKDENVNLAERNGRIYDRGERGQILKLLKNEITTMKGSKQTQNGRFLSSVNVA